MKKTLALLLAIGGTTSFANPDLEEKVRQLSAVTQRIKKLKEKKSLHIKERAQKKKNIIQFSEKIKSIDDYLNDLTKILPPAHLQGDTLKNLISQIEARIEYVTSENFKGAMRKLASKTHLVNSISSAYTFYSFLVADEITYLKQIKNDDSLMPWVLPLLKKHAFSTSYEIPSEEFPPFTPCAHDKDLINQFNIHQKSIAATNRLLRLLRAFVTNPISNTIKTQQEFKKLNEESIKLEEINLYKPVSAISRYNKILAKLKSTKHNLKKQINIIAQELHDLKKIDDDLPLVRIELKKLKSSLNNQLDQLDHEQNKLNSAVISWESNFERNKSEFHLYSQRKEILHNLKADLEQLSPPNAHHPEWLEKLRAWITYIRSDSLMADYNRLMDCYEEKWEAVSDNKNHLSSIIKNLYVSGDDSLKEVILNYISRGDDTVKKTTLDIFSSSNSTKEVTLRDIIRTRKLTLQLPNLIPSFLPDTGKGFDKIFTHWASKEAAPLWLNPWIEECISQKTLIPLSNFLLTHKDRGYGVPSADDELMAKETYQIIRNMPLGRQLFRIHISNLDQKVKEIDEYIEEIKITLDVAEDEIKKRKERIESFNFELKRKELKDKIDEADNKIEALIIRESLKEYQLIHSP